MSSRALRGPSVVSLTSVRLAQAEIERGPEDDQSEHYGGPSQAHHRLIELDRPRHLAIAMLGMVSWYTAAPQISRTLIGDAADPKTTASHRATPWNSPAACSHRLHDAPSGSTEASGTRVAANPNWHPEQTADQSPPPPLNLSLRLRRDPCGWRHRRAVVNACSPS
jgi:hypothetical protein